MCQDTDQALLSSRTEQCSEQDEDEAEEGVHFAGSRNSSRAAHAFVQSSGPTNSRPRRGRPVVAGSGGTRRRGAESPAVVRFPGHDRKKPYNSFHRFQKVRLMSRLMLANPSITALAFDLVPFFFCSVHES